MEQGRTPSIFIYQQELEGKPLISLAVIVNLELIRK
jgi:hypothetical protein